ncbi:MAG: M28 family peptidase [Chloroflexi bacterium]|nr:M28 family peptidase [Chloroflexota bacterium]
MQQPPFTPNTQRLRATVEAIAAQERHRRDRRSESLALIDQVYMELGLVVTGHWYSFRGQVGNNLAGRMRGVDWWLPPLVVCAHYDTVEGTVGADDNASGVAVMLECAHLLAPLSLRRSVEFLAVDMEEPEAGGAALTGSQAFTQEIIGVAGYEGIFNLDMVGYTSGPGTQRLPSEIEGLFPDVAGRMAQQGHRGDDLAIVSNRQSAPLVQAFTSGVQQHTPDLGLVTLELPEDRPALADLFRGDHISFWAMDVPAILLTDTGDYRNPNRHTVKDTPETLDYGFMAKVTAALAGTLAALAQQ